MKLQVDTEVSPFQPARYTVTCADGRRFRIGKPIPMGCWVVFSHSASPVAVGEDFQAALEWIADLSKPPKLPPNREVREGD